MPPWSWGVNEVVVGLICDGALAGVGAVLGFVPQMLVLFLMLSILEDVGYMARVAFIMDRIFRKFGLSGKSFIPMLIGSGCGVPGVMASRTIENERDRRMTVMTTCFVPCGAKMPIIGPVRRRPVWRQRPGGGVRYFIGVAAIIFSGIILKKTKAFCRRPRPLRYGAARLHVPSVATSCGPLGSAAGPSSSGPAPSSWPPPSSSGSSRASALPRRASAWWRTTTPPCWRPLAARCASFSGPWVRHLAGHRGHRYRPHRQGERGVHLRRALRSGRRSDGGGPRPAGRRGTHFTALSAYSFMIFNLLCAPCFAAMGAIKREMNNARWTLGAIGYMCGFAYVVSLIVYQLGGLITGEVSFGIGTIAAAAALVGLVYLLVRRNKYDENTLSISAVAAAAK